MAATHSSDKTDKSENECLSHIAALPCTVPAGLL